MCDRLIPIASRVPSANSASQAMLLVDPVQVADVDQQPDTGAKQGRPMMLPRAPRLRSVAMMKMVQPAIRMTPMK